MGGSSRSSSHRFWRLSGAGRCVPYPHYPSVEQPRNSFFRVFVIQRESRSERCRTPVVLLRNPGPRNVITSGRNFGTKLRDKTSGQNFGTKLRDKTSGQNCETAKLRTAVRDDE